MRPPLWKEWRWGKAEGKDSRYKAVTAQARDIEHLGYGYVVGLKEGGRMVHLAVRKLNHLDLGSEWGRDQNKQKNPEGAWHDTWITGLNMRTLWPSGLTFKYSETCSVQFPTTFCATCMRDVRWCFLNLFGMCDVSSVARIFSRAH